MRSKVYSYSVKFPTEEVLSDFRKTLSRIKVEEDRPYPDILMDAIKGYKVKEKNDELKDIKEYYKSLSEEDRGLFLEFMSSFSYDDFKNKEEESIPDRTILRRSISSARIFDYGTNNINPVYWAIGDASKLENGTSFTGDVYAVAIGSITVDREELKRQMDCILKDFLDDFEKSGLPNEFLTKSKVLNISVLDTYARDIPLWKRTLFDMREKYVRKYVYKKGEFVLSLGYVEDIG